MSRLLLAALLTAAGASFAAPSEPFHLWPGTAPGDTGELPSEADITTPSDRLVNGVPIVRLGNVSDPTITVYPADPAKNTGAAVIGAPGGGYHILAIELEGTEVCEWLNSIGVTGVLLKYRVPSQAGTPRRPAPLQDAQRAISIVRHRAAEFGVDPHRVGMLGFSAGGHLTAWTTAASAKPRTYEAIDDADSGSTRPDFMVLIYPGGVVNREEGDAVSPEVAPIAGHTPPAFIAMAEDDPVRVENAIQYFLALKAAGVPAEMHLYPTGGHGYGLRRNADHVTSWPGRVTDWMKWNGWLTRAP